MLDISYEIKLNELNRPYISLPKDYEDKPEDKFFAIEVAKYFLHIGFVKNHDKYNNKTKEVVEVVVNFLSQIGDEMAEIMFDNMKASGEMSMMLNKNYHISVDKFEELDKLGEYIVYDNKIFKKQDSLKCLVKENNLIYEFNNDSWIEK